MKYRVPVINTQEAEIIIEANSKHEACTFAEEKMKENHYDPQLFADRIYDEISNWEIKDFPELVEDKEE